MSWYDVSAAEEDGSSSPEVMPGSLIADQDEYRENEIYSSGYLKKSWDFGWGRNEYLLMTPQPT